MSQSIRHIWIIKLSPGSSSSLIFHRKFPTVEKRARHIHGNKYTPVPSPSQLLPLLLQKIDRTYTGSRFIPSRDRCDLQVQKPVYKLPVEGGVLWPLVAIEKHGLLFCCLPLVEDTVTEESYTPIKELSTSVGLVLLFALADFLKVTSQEFPSRVLELTLFLNEAAPFGQVRDASSENVCSRLSDRPCSVPKAGKLPSWKASTTKGKPTLHVCVSEYINASQCAQETWRDQSHVFGRITCKPELDVGITDVTLNLTNTQSDMLRTPLDGLTLHPCVLRADWSDQNSRDGLESRAAPRRIRFCPPNEGFTLCDYTVSSLTELPVFGVYHMKPEECSASLTVQLKLNDQIKNQFDFFELRIPFYTRSLIAGVESSTSQGSVLVSGNKRELLWNIGPRFITKEHEAQLTATVTFSGAEQSMPAPTAEDAFCRGNNSYAQLNFKISDFTHSGCCVDPKSIQVNPSTKIKLNLNREYSSKDYKIWNSGGVALKVDPNI